MRSPWKHQKGFAPGTSPISATRAEPPDRNRFLFPFLLAILGLILLYGPSPGYYDHRIIHAFWAYGHLGFFTVLTLLLLRWRVPHWPRSVALPGLRLAVVLVVLALVSEGLQLFVKGRTAGLDDAAQNLLGIALGFALSPHWLSRLPSRWSRILPHLTLPTVAVAALVPWMALADTLHGQVRFPVLLAMETELEMGRVRGSDNRRRVLDTPLAPGSVLAVHWLPPGGGVGIQHFPQDWRGYDQLHIRVHSDQTLPVTLRLHDRRHEALGEPWPDRFNRSLVLEPGWQTLVIDLDDVRQAPSSRTMSLARMSQLGLFNLELEHPAVLHLDTIELVRSSE